MPGVRVPNVRRKKEKQDRKFVPIPNRISHGPNGRKSAADSR